MKNICQVRSIDPQTLSNGDFKRLQEVSQDLWAHSIGEFVQCHTCKNMMGKQDIFGHLAKELYDETVQKIMTTLEIKEIPCTSCGEQTHFIYPESHIKNIRQRLLTLDSHIVIAENEKQEIVGYMDGYLDSIEGIFHREYFSHYENIGLHFIQKRVHEILGYTPKQMLGYSGVGLIEKYSNFYNIFALMREFYKTVKNIPHSTPAMTEIDQNNNFGDLFEYMGYQALGIQQSPLLSGKVTNIGKNYKSELIVFERPIYDYQRRFGDVGIKGFLKIFSKQKPKTHPIGEPLYA